MYHELNYNALYVLYALLQHKFRDQYAISLNPLKTKKKILLPSPIATLLPSVFNWLLPNPPHKVHRFLLQLLDPKADNLEISIEEYM